MRQAGEVNTNNSSLQVCARCRQETLVDVVKMKMVLSDGEESVPERNSQKE